MPGNRFPSPIAGYDIHVYFYQDDPIQVQSASALHARVAKIFPEIRLSSMCPQPVGPHVTGMFQVFIETPEQFSQVVPWITLNRNEHSVLVHPHSGNAVFDHSKYAMWIGERLPVNLELLRRHFSS
ncbi:hypothetical protein IWQ61_002505 [Dispira simplex]|nr:hypothetical protein IWQ61_002505 [Dispira simplex]